MQVGIIGLRGMGANMVCRRVRHGHEATVCDREHRALATPAQQGAAPAARLICRAAALKQCRVRSVDIATSGSVSGLAYGHCLMIADQKEVVVCLDPIVTALTPGTGNVPAFSGRDGRDLPVACGYIHVGSSGAGHLVKTVHNGVEYRLMQAYARVFDIPKNAGTEALPEAERFNLDIADIAEMWRRGSVITSSLLDLAACALANEGSLDGCCGFVQHSGEGRRTEQAAIDETAAVDLLSAAVFAWFRSRRLAEKTLSAMRTGFSRPKALQP